MTAPVVRNSVAPPANGASSVNSPSDTAIGDLLIFVGVDLNITTAPTISAQSGFTMVTTQAVTEGGVGYTLAVAWKVATLAGAQSYTPFSTNGIGSWDTGIGLIVVTKDTFDAAAPIDVFASTSDTGTGPPDPPSITTTEADTMALAVGYWNISPSSTVAVTPPTGYTEIWEVAGNKPVELSAARKDVASAGAENPSAFADDTANVTNTIAVAFAIAPYVAATAGLVMMP